MQWIAFVAEWLSGPEGEKFMNGLATAYGDLRSISSFRADRRAALAALLRSGVPDEDAVRRADAIACHIRWSLDTDSTSTGRS